MKTRQIMGFALEHTSAAHAHALRATGRLVAGVGAEHPAWTRAVAAADATPVVVDLRGVTALDASGVGQLLRLRRAVTRRGARLSITAASARVRRLLTLSGLSAALELAPDQLCAPHVTRADAAAARSWCRCA